MKDDKITKQAILDKLDILAFYEKELGLLKVGSSGEQAMALCPFHEERKPSFSVNLKTGIWHCFGCEEKGSIFEFYMKKHHVDYATALQKLSEIAGTGTRQVRERKILETYDYVDEKGNLLSQTVRYEPKAFRQRRPDGEGGWIWNTKGVRLVLYNLPDLLKVRKHLRLIYEGKVLSTSPTVFITEGEKDADTLKELDLVATCNPMGVAGKWRQEFNEYFRGKRVVILPDIDGPAKKYAGEKHAQFVAQSLKGIASSTKVIKLPGLPEKGKDVTDWIQSGGTKERLLEIVRETPEWIPEEPKSLLSTLLKWNDIFNLDVKIEYLLEGLIPKGGITLMFGRGGIGKTSLCMQIARAIANGTTFCERKTIKTPCYYIDFENPLPVLKERVEKIGRSDNLYVWHRSNEVWPPYLDSDEWTRYKQLPPGFIFFDTLRASHLSDENDSKPMSLIMGRLKELRETGFTILLLHHTPKANDNIFKGSTALLDLCDHVLGLEEVKDGENVEFDCHNLYRFGCRQKTRYEPHAIYLTFDPEIKGFRLAVDPDIEKMEGICEILKKSTEPLKQKEIMGKIKDDKDLDLSDREVRRLLNKGTGQYWSAQKGNQHNAILYTPVFQFSDPIYRDQTEKQTTSTDYPSNNDIETLKNKLRLKSPRYQKHGATDR